jgi:hypothetical protein
LTSGGLSLLLSLVKPERPVTKAAVIVPDRKTAKLSVKSSDMMVVS